MTFHKTLFVICLLAVFLLLSSLGCRDEQTPPEATESVANATATLVSFPDDKTLAALGPKNNVEARWALDKSLLVLVMQPQQFLKSVIAQGAEDFVAESIAQRFQIPFSLRQLDRVVQSSGVPFTFVVENEVNGQKTPQQVAMMRRTTEMTFITPIQKEEVIRFFLMDSTIAIDTLKKKMGAVEYYELNGNDPKQPGRLAVTFPDDKTVVLLEGHVSDIATVFDGVAPTSATLERLKRMNTQSDLMMALSIEGNGMPAEEVQAMLLQAGMAGDLAELIAKNFRAATLSLDLSSEQSEAIATVALDIKTSVVAQEIAEKLDGQIVQLQTDWMGVNENQRAGMILSHEFLTHLLNSVVVEASDARVLLRAERIEGFATTVNSFLKNLQAQFREARLRQARQEQLQFLGRFFQMYYEANGKYPSDIKAADGTPLLSWRVALLPTVQQNELYKKFNLEEPWDGETNKELLAQMPFIYRPLSPNVELPKTLMRFFSSEGTPFANPNLKREDLKHPESTLMLLSVAPEQAVEWTKPDTLEFDLASLEKTVGNVLYGVLFSGQYVSGVPILPLSDERSEMQRKFLDALIRGLPQPEPPTPNEPEAASSE